MGKTKKPFALVLCTLPDNGFICADCYGRISAKYRYDFHLIGATGIEPVLYWTNTRRIMDKKGMCLFCH